MHPGSYFGSDLPVVIDIGIGIGESCIEMAAADPSIAIVGVDVHTPGIANALIAIEDRDLTNLRVFHGDVFELIPRLQHGSVHGIRVFFPDPWPKPRHRRRRLITSERLSNLTGLLEPEGWVHLATDSQEYADQMQRVCDQHGLVGGVIDRPAARPLTRFEQRGIDAGRPIVDLWFERRVATD